MNIKPNRFFGISIHRLKSEWELGAMIEMVAKVKFSSRVEGNQDEGSLLMNINVRMAK